MSDIHLIIEKLGAKIDSLQSDKKELVSFLEKLYVKIETDNTIDMGEIESILQKHKQ